MGRFTPDTNLSEKAARVLASLGDSGASEGLAVADCLNTIASNGGEQASDSHIAGSAVEIADAAEYVARELVGAQPRTMQVVIEMFGGTYQGVEVFASHPAAAEHFITKMREDCLPGFADIHEHAYISRAAYADALYQAHRDALEGSDYDQKEFYWDETEVTG